MLRMVSTFVLAVIVTVAVESAVNAFAKAVAMVVPVLPLAYEALLVIPFTVRETVPESHTCVEHDFRWHPGGAT